MQGEIVKGHEESLMDNLFNVASRKVHTIQDSSFVDMDKIYHKPTQTVSKNLNFSVYQKGKVRGKLREKEVEQLREVFE